MRAAAAALGGAGRVLWHNPACSKSRAALSLLEARAPGTFTLRRYLEDPPTLPELRVLRSQLQRPAIEWTRTGDPAWASVTLDGAGDGVDDDEGVLAAIAAAPRLLERPILVDGAAGRAVVGRPAADNVLALLGGTAGADGTGGASSAGAGAPPQQLPAGPPAGVEVEVGGGAAKLDALGPVVVNTDGSLSRITNWGQMAEVERTATMRIIGKPTCLHHRRASAGAAAAGPGQGALAARRRNQERPRPPAATVMGWELCVRCTRACGLATWAVCHVQREERERGVRGGDR